MFRMGGPIKEGIMDGIEEPRKAFQSGSNPGLFGFTFDKPFDFSNLFKTPKTVEKEKQKLANIFAPDYSMSEYGMVPKLKNPDEQLTASTSNVKIPKKEYEMVSEDVISVNDIDQTSGDQDDAFNIPKTSTYDMKMAEGTLKKGGDADSILPKKKPIDTAETTNKDKLKEILGYDRAVKRGNYRLIEAIRKGLTEGGVQGALDAAFAAGEGAYQDADKLKQVIGLKEYERDIALKDYDKKRKDELEDYEKKIKLKAMYDTTSAGKGIIQKNYEFLTGVLKMDPDKAQRIATKETEATLDAQILDVQKSAGLPAVTTDVLDGAGGIFYGSEYKGKASSQTDTGSMADGWYLIDGSQFVEIENGKVVGKSRKYEPKG